MKSAKFKYIFFDMDGVLVNSEDAHFSAWQQTLDNLGLPSDWMDFNELIGVSDTTNAQQIIERFNLKIALDELYQQKKEAFIKCITKGFPVHDGRDHFLSHAKQHFEFALVSSASRIEINKILQQESIKHYFSFLIGNDDVTHHKPHPMPYQKALQQAKINSEQALIIEDSESGIRAALAAGIQVIALESNAVISQEIKSSVPFFSDFHAIKKWLFNC